MSLARAFAECFPLVVGDATVEVTAVDPTEDRVTITARLVTKDGADVVDVREQTFALERGAPGARPDRVPLRPDEIDPAVLAANVRHHLGWADFPMPADLFEPPAPFRPVGPFDDALHLGEVGAAIAEQAWAHGFDLRYWVVAQWPEQARALFFAHAVYAMAGGNGLEVYLHQNDPAEVVGALEALTSMGCDRLAQRYREALGLAREEGAEPLTCVDEDWLDEHAMPPPSGWRAIDSHEEGGTYWSIDHELVPAASAFLRAHRALLLAP